MMRRQNPMGDRKRVMRHEALALVLQSIPPLDPVVLPLEKTLNCAAGEDVHASHDVPEMDRAAMDGYAISVKETRGASHGNPARFVVIGKIDPGVTELAPVRRGQAVRIATGAPLPPGTDAVVKEEETPCNGKTIEVTETVPPFLHVVKRGKELRRKSLVVRKGQVIAPPVVGALASLRRKEVCVVRRPKVAIVAAGSELAPVNGKPTHYSVVASNMYMLSAMIKAKGGEVDRAVIAGDDKAVLGKEIEEGLKADMLVTTGGTSKADSDLTLGVMKALGVDFAFCGVSMLPGKGTAFGLGHNKPVFCLPGTPSAVFVSFYTLVLPALLRLRGLPVPRESPMKAVLEDDLKKRPGMEHLVQGLMGKKGGTCCVLPLTGPGTEIFTAMSLANGLIIVGPQESDLKKGETVLVKPLNAFEPALLTRAFSFRRATQERTAAAPPIVSFVGKSDAGKTTLLERLVPLLRMKGYRVGTVKHDVHGFDIDHEGKDSWRHKQAGACTVVISSPHKVSVIKDVDAEESLDGLASAYFQDADIILTEGYKRQDKPKIEVFRSGVHAEPLCAKDDRLAALVSDTPLDFGVPRFELNDIKGLADFVEETFLRAP
jgi:molybdopterin molybdotransferase